MGRQRRLGVHTSISGGLHMALLRASALGCSTVQIFSHNPRGWTARGLSSGEISDFRRLRKELRISPVFVHASYLINIASASGEVLGRSVAMLREEMSRADAIGADYVVLHPGSARDGDGVRRVIDSLRKVLTGSYYRAGLLMENTSGKRGDICSTPEELSLVIAGSGGLAAGVCIDTCHAFAAGYDLRSQSGLEKLALEFERHLGGESLRLVHLNDSRSGCGTGSDRHEHLGMGMIGLAALKGFVRHETFGGAPLILETPKAGDEDDLDNLERARSILVPD